MSNASVFKYLTFDKSYVREFEGFATGRIVQGSAHPDRIVILKNPSEDEIKRLVLEYERVSIEDGERRLLRRTGAAGELFRPFWLQGNQCSFIRLSWFIIKYNQRCKGDIRSFEDMKLMVDAMDVDEQVNLWNIIKPDGMEEKRLAYSNRFISQCRFFDLENIFSKYGFWPAIDVFVTQLTYPSYRKAIDGEKVIDGCEGREWIHDSANKARVLTLLCYLQSKGIILFSFGVYKRLRRENQEENGQGTNLGNLAHTIICAPGFLRPDIVQLVKLEVDRVVARRQGGESTRQESYMNRAWFLMSSTVYEIGDISPGLFDWVGTSAARYRWVEDLINVFEERYRDSNKRFPRPQLTNKNFNPDAKSRSFDWMSEQAPWLIPWMDLMNRYIFQSPTTYLESKASPLNYFASYLIELGEVAAPESPEQLDRRLHVRRVVGHSSRHQTFREFLDSRICVIGKRIGETISPGTRSRAMNGLRCLMAFHIEGNRSLQEKADVALKLMMVNPVQKDDCKWRDAGRSGKTHRDVVPDIAVSEIKRILLSPDAQGNPTFQWLMENVGLKTDWVSVPCLNGSWPHFKEIDGQTLYWQPSRGLILYLLLSIPLRLFQARWLDSGLADENIWKFGRVEEVKNEKSFAKRGVRNGVFQPDERLAFDQLVHVGIHVTTNKNQAWRANSRVAPFDIPWPQDDIYELLDLQRRWAFYLAENVYTEAVRVDFKSVNPEVESLLPQFHPLFRDYCSDAALYPVSRMKVEMLWTLVCAEAQERLRAAGFKITLVVPGRGADGTKPEMKARYDMHSLRVTGTTRLLAMGVPVHIVSQYVLNHGAITTTYVYDRTSLATARTALASHLTLDPAQRDAVHALQSLLTSMDDGSPLSPEQVRAVVGNERYRSFFLHRGDASSESSALACAANGKEWRVMADGICPGGDCETGGPEGIPVEAGPGRCGNCRYFMTGTAFVFQQAHRCNSLMYELQELIHANSNLRKERRVMDVRSEEYGYATQRLEQGEICSQSLFLDWWGRYRLFQATIDELAANKGKGVLLTKSDAETLKLGARVTSKVQLLAELCASTEILKLDLEKRGPQLEYYDLLNVLLEKGGAKPLPIANFGTNKLGLTNVVGEALFHLFRAEFNCNAEQAFSKMEAVATSDEVVSARLAQSIKRVAEAVKMESSPRRKKLDLQ